MQPTPRSQRVQELFEAGLALEAGERRLFLDEACAGDDGLRAEVAGLLSSLDDAATDQLFPPLFGAGSPPSLLGERLGPYVIRKELAEGGMGAVYLAEREDVGMQVALKLVRYGRLAAPEHVQRFFLERRLLARLDHPNIARLLDAGVTEHRLPYLVMEYVDGQPVDRYCDARRLGIEQRLRLFLQVCDAVECAHLRGIVHRDLKPSNILVQGEGRGKREEGREERQGNAGAAEGTVKLLDFGIAKLIEESTAGDSRLTRTGALLATPEYASPEQIRGEAITARSDVYSLGVILYELLSGHHPYRLTGRTPREIERVVCATDPEPPSARVLRTTEIVRADGLTERITPVQVSDARDTRPERLRQRLGGDLDSIVSKALRKDPEERYGSVGELRDDLRRHLDGLPVRARGGPRLSRLQRWSGHGARGLPRLAVLAAVVVGLIVGIGALRGGEPPRGAGGAVSPHTVAVLPFAVHGGSDLDPLRHGIVELLGRGLDGAGELRSADPRLVRGLAAAGEALDPERGRRLAAHAGAGLFVLGTVTELNGRLRIVASLFDAEARPVAQAEAEGAEEELFGLVDQLALQLLAGNHGGPAHRVTRNAILSGHSLPAVRAYLQGEAHYRAARHAVAVEAFQRAVDLDSTFALAHYRLAVAALSTNFTERMHRALEAAERHGDRLDARDRMLLQAFAALTRSDAERAERLYRRILFEYPEETEAWYFLGEVHFHLNPYRGRSLREARQVFENALGAEAHVREATAHLVQIAALERDRDLFSAMVARLRAADPSDPVLPQAEVLHAVLWGDPQEQSRAIAAASRLNDTRLLILLWRVAMYSADYEASERLARLLLPNPRPPELRAFGHYTLGDLALAQGRWQSARREVLQARRWEPLRTLQLRAFYTTLPYLPVERDSLLALRDSLLHTVPDPAAAPNDPPFPTTDLDTRPALRLYLMALLELRLGEAAAARRRADELERLGGTDAEARYARSLAQSIRARLLHAEGRHAEALAALEAGGMGRNRDYAPSHFAAQAAERFLRAELLLALGRDEEALGWYGSLTEIAVADLVYLGPALLRRGEIHQRLDQREEAAATYARLIELWQDCDPELAGLRHEAERRLARLRAAS